MQDALLRIIQTCMTAAGPLLVSPKARLLCSSGPAADKIIFDETVAANPEEIDLGDDDGDDGGDKEVDAEAAEVAKQELAGDAEMLQASALHNYRGSAEAASDHILETHSNERDHTKKSINLSAALAAILPQVSEPQVDADKPDKTS